MVPLDSVNVQSNGVDSVLWPHWVGRHSENKCSFSFVVPLDSLDVQSSGVHSVLWPLWWDSVQKTSVHSVLWPLCIQSMFRATRWSSGAQRIVLLYRWCFRARLVWLRSCGSPCSSLSSLSVRVLCKSFMPVRGARAQICSFSFVVLSCVRPCSEKNVFRVSVVFQNITH